MTLQTVHRNLPIDTLITHSLGRKETVKSKNGSLIVYTGKYTGRSPKDKFIVDTHSVHNLVDWNPINQPFTEEGFQNLYDKVTKYFSKKKDLYIFDGFAGADDSYKLHVRVVSEFAYQTIFATHLLRRPTVQELAHHIPQLTILSAPDFKADPSKDNTNSEAFVILNIDKGIVLIGGTKYSGEIKKAIFSVMNILLPQKKVLPMHCSANIGDDGKTALFFGLSGTGKTTLSADPKRRLIGDDEHGWGKNGIFNFEGGCYAKCIHLKKENEPQIWNAIRDRSLLENVVTKPDGELDFSCAGLTENTRAIYPIEFIENAVLSGIGDHPRYIIFLTADAFGVIPPIAKLSIDAAIYHFMSGYTSKIAGTELGITKPRATFSPFFGEPFMALKPSIYMNLFKNYLHSYKTKLYLVNTGWSGGSFGIGNRISISDTRGIVSAVLEGKLDTITYRKDPLFNLEVPLSIPEINQEILVPQKTWKDKSAFQTKAKELARLFVENFKRFNDIPQAIIRSGPRL